MRTRVVIPLCLLQVFALSCAAQGEYEEEVRLLERLIERALDDGSYPASCTAKYRALGDSTMCIYEDSDQVSQRGVSAAQKQAIVDQHNDYRRHVNPSATNMQKMYWDDEIAVIAQKWANVCPPTPHDKNRRVPGYGVKIGQNYAAGFDSWSEAVEAWHAEVKRFQYGVNPHTYLKPGKPVGHYTQVVTDNAVRIGCGFAMCADRPVHVCNYALGNHDDYGMAYGKPYESGASCAACVGTCSNNLCDCKGKLCLNGGTLDPNTCTCACRNHYSGDTCEQDDGNVPGFTERCPGKDASYCKNGGWLNNDCECHCISGLTGDRCDTMPADRCPVFDHVRWCAAVSNKGKNCDSFGGNCPHLCGYCQETCPGKGRDYCKNRGTLERDCTCTCTKSYQGERCEKWVPSSCPAGDNENTCKWVTPSDCETSLYYRKSCPYFCGVCEGKCGTKRCLHRGSLQDDCTCKCSGKFDGEECEVFKLENCPMVDDDWCNDITGNYVPRCESQSNYQNGCPIKCGLCPEKCPGKTKGYCKNKGVLKEDCTCSCKAGYSGATCEQRSGATSGGSGGSKLPCPAGTKDNGSCKNWPQRYCTKWKSVLSVCPIKCGVCVVG